MGKLVRKRYDMQVTSSGQRVTETFELDKNIQFVRGILVTSDRDDIAYYRGSQKIEINGEEHFPENYESKLLMSGMNLSPHSRYYDLGLVPTGNKAIKMVYTDTSSTQAAFTAYRVSLYVLGELEG